uniref:Uncharacterized protein n=1 Tax=Knipowitschia caucasica TaxID=637954 RepID=A0AAV2L0I5_KNICA
MHSRIDETPKKKVSFSPITAICEFDRDEPPAAVSKSHELNSDQETEEQLIQETSGLKGPEELGLSMQARHQDSSLATQKKSVSGLLQEKCDCEKILKQREEQNKELLREAAELKEKVAELEDGKRELNDEALNWIEELKSKDMLAMQVNKLRSDLVDQKKLFSEGEAQQKAIKENLALSQSRCQELQEQLQEATGKCDCKKTIQQTEERNVELLREARDLKDQVVRLKEEKRQSDIDTLKWKEELKKKEKLVNWVKKLRSSLAAQKKLVSEVEERNIELVREATELKNQVIRLDEVENDRKDSLRQLQQELANTQHDLELKKECCKKLEQDNVSLLRNVEQLNRNLAESGNLSQSPNTYVEEQEKAHVVAAQKLQNSDQEEIVQSLNSELARRNKTIEYQILKIAGPEKQVWQSDVLKGEIGELKRENLRLLRCVDLKERKRGIATQKLQEALSASVVSAAAIKSLEEAIHKFAIEIAQKEATIVRQSYKIAALQKQVQESVGFKAAVEESKKEIVRLRNSKDREEAHAQRLHVLSTSSAMAERREKELHKLMFDIVQQETTIKCQSFQIEGLNKLAREAVRVKRELEE